MSATVTAQLTPPSRASLDAVPWVDVAGNLRTATVAGTRFSTMMMEVLSLRRGAGQLTMAEYFYYRLWDSGLTLEEKRRFVGKNAQHAMHLSCNDHAWYGVTHDKLLFHAVMTNAGFPVPPLLAIAHPTRGLPGVPHLTSSDAAQSLLRDRDVYPFFAKPIDGIYSLGAISAEHLNTSGQVRLTGGGDRPLVDIADELTGTENGMLIQRRLKPDAELAERFGNRLWSVRLFILLSADGPKITRAVCKIPAAGSMADNFWRTGNMIAAVELESGRMTRAVRGTGQEMEVDFVHPQTAQPIVGAQVPGWNAVIRMAEQAASMFPGVRTQSWDVALTDRGPVLLELNWGGDLNLAQLAYGQGVLDETFAGHLEANRYERSRSERKLMSLRVGLRRG